MTPVPRQKRKQASRRGTARTLWQDWRKGPIHKGWRKGRREEAEVTLMICAEILGKLHLATEVQERMRRLMALTEHKFLLELQRPVQPVLFFVFFRPDMVPQTQTGRQGGVADNHTPCLNTRWNSTGPRNMKARCAVQGRCGDKVDIPCFKRMCAALMCLSEGKALSCGLFLVHPES